MVQLVPPSTAQKQRRRAALLFSCLLALALSAGGLRAVVRAPDISGAIRVIDGDTFDVGDTRVRLHGIDAPESDQICQTEQGTEWACGGWITKVVTDRYTDATAECDAVDIDRYGRTVARCRALGEDIGGWLVREGFAFAYVKYADDYIAIEQAAAAADRGLHAVRIQSPSQHRLARVKGRIAPDKACAIKGNVSANGARIYHRPGQAFYDRTGIDTGKGERWFCSEASAQAAGWRAARR